MTEVEPHFVMMAGNIGSGKTRCARRLAERLGWTAAYEAIAHNQYLGDYYREPGRWAFHLAVHNLELRLRQHRQVKALNVDSVLDRTIYEDRYVFVEMQRDTGFLSERDYQCYVALWELLAEQIPTPDAIVYLEAPTDVLLQRIHERGRGVEQGIAPEYLTLLQTRYQLWIDQFDACPVIREAEAPGGTFDSEEGWIHLLTALGADSGAGRVGTSGTVA